MSQMMKIDPKNPVIHQSIKNYLIKDKDETVETFYDYDNCRYEISKAGNFLLFGFSSNCHQQIMNNGGQEMLDALYKDSLASNDMQL